MKLQAVTICINYADHLECIVANRRHFDRWVVVTVPGDAATVAVCARHGLEVVFSRTLQPDGKDFNAANNKARALNEGLAALDPEGWAVILDSDVLLPRHFRERVAALPLEKGCLYGAAGRKICEDREMFEMLRACEPWDRLCDRSSQALGYFNLFHLEHPVNRYVERRKGETGGHDDYFFTTSFPPECRRQIPMTVIHTGPSHTNWAGRVAQSYHADGAAVAAELPEEIAGAGSVAVIGYIPGSRWREMARRSAKVLLVDHFQVHHPSGSPLVEADRAVLRGLWEKEAADFANVQRLGTHSATTLAGIADGSLDALYLPGEVTPDWLTVALRHWRPKLRDGALVCGDLYGLPHWREATFTVSLLLGPPDGVTAAGFWWKRMAAADWQLAPPEEGVADFSTQDGVVLVNRAKETIEKLLLTLHTARAQWAGPLAVYHWGDDDPSLTIACARMGVKLWNVGEVPEGEEVDGWIMEVATIQPFRRALILQPGMLAVGALAGAFTPCEPVAGPAGAAPLLAVRDGAGPQRSAAACVEAQAFQGGAQESAVLVCEGDPATWTEAAWEAWSVAEAGLAQALAAGVRVAADATVVTFVDEESVGDFQRCSLTWKFPPGTPVLVVLTGLRAEDVWLPGATPETRMVALSRKQVDDVPWLLGWIARAATTTRVVFLPCRATALPGAELWAGELWRETAAVLDWTRAAREEEGVTGNRFLPEPFFGMIDKARLAEVAAMDLARAATLRELPLVMHEALQAESADRPWEASLKGWRRPATHLYVPTGERVKNAADTRVAVRQNADGEWLLADEAIVISLPERTDRRQRVRAAMQHPHRVKFRFVDGVRVTDEEIDPEEVAEVHLHTFKLVAGAQKFLRGTVGCRRAHLRCLEEAYRVGLKSLLLIEDDMQMVDGWFERYVAALSELPKGWLQLYLSSSDFRRAEPFSANLHRLTGAYQTTAILYSEAGIEAALKAVRRSRHEVDAWLGNHLHPFGGSYAIRPGITFQQGGVSDIMSFDRGVTP